MTSCFEYVLVLEKDKDNLSVSIKNIHALTLEPNHPTSGKICHKICLYRYRRLIYQDSHCSVIYKSKRLATAQVPIKKGLIK